MGIGSHSVLVFFTDVRGSPEVHADGVFKWCLMVSSRDTGSSGETLGEDIHIML
jgi:hypothetical protein